MITHYCVLRQNDLQVRINGVMQTPERCNYYQLETLGILAR
jgi:hypothetical protein